MKPKTVGRVNGDTDRHAYAQLACHGFPVGTQILTADGDLPVEYLSPGDGVVTRNGGMMRLEAVHATTVSTRAVLVTSGSLGVHRPGQDVILPADQPVLIRDWRARALYGASQALASAGQLVDGEFIKDIGPRKLVLFRLAFDRPRVIYVNGLELGTSGEVNKPQRAVA